MWYLLVFVIGILVGMVGGFYTTMWVLKQPGENDRPEGGY